MVELILNCFIYIRDSFIFLLVRLKTFIWKVFKIELLLNLFGIEVNSLLYLRLNVCLLFSFLPFRLLAFFGLPFIYRLGIGFLFAVVILSYSQVIILAILDNKVFQLWFYYSLCVDEKFKRLDSIYRVFFFLFIAASIIFISFFLMHAGYLFWSCLICWSFYRSLKTNFVNLKNKYCFTYIRSLPYRSLYFTWFDIVDNMQVVCFALFNLIPYNKLSDSVCQTQFRYLIRSIIPKRLSNKKLNTK